MAKYSWRDGFSWKVKASIAGKEIERIRRTSGGSVTPEAVVQHARQRSSPLHDAFEWNDAKAAEAHRLQTARSMIASLTVVIEAAKEIGPVRAFVHIAEPNDRRYTSMGDAMSMANLRSIVVKRALREAEGWRARYKQYSELAEVFEAIDHVSSRRTG